MSRLSLRFGEPETQWVRDGHGVRLALSQPLISGDAEGVMELERGEVFEKAGFCALEDDDWLVGCRVSESGDLETAAREAYEGVFSLLGEKKLVRVWHFVPGINEIQDGLERYRRFNAGRHAAFEHQFQASFPAALPAASATGIGGERFAAVFLATRFPVRYCENPRQVQSWKYPEKFGPKAPGFARGAVVDTPQGPAGFLSGTASIVGSESVEQGDFAGQIRVTWENLEIMMSEMGYDAVRDSVPLNLHVYLRHAEDEATARAHLTAAAGKNLRSLRIVQGDICRADLDVEVEAFVGSAPPFLAE